MHRTKQQPKGGTRPIDTMPRLDALSVMLASHAAAVTAVSGAQNAIDEAAECIAKAVGTGGTLFYVAAGSSGLMALADASELPGTFGIPSHQIRICMAGGVPTDGVMPGDTEDEVSEAIAFAQEMRPQDVAIVVSASGTTPFAVAFAEVAKTQGNAVVGLSNVSGSQLLEISHIAIALATEPEVLAGSTRLGAGTAQKVALNMISTQAGILLGHVYKGLMVNFIPDNKKLRLRARDIVMAITNVSEVQADRALELAAYDTKLAILISTGLDIETARENLIQTGGHLSRCMPE